MFTIYDMHDMWYKAYDIWEEVLSKSDDIYPVLEYMCDKLAGTEFRLIKTKNVAGRWYYRERILEMSEYTATYRTEQENMNTFLHEMLHGLTPYEGHNGKWREYAELFNTTKYAKEYGKITRCYVANNKLKEVKYNHMLICDKCGIVNGKIRKSETVQIWKLRQNHEGNVGRCRCGNNLNYKCK